MKRRLFKLALFLFLGAIINVAVAWLCVVVELDYEAESDFLSEYERAWLRDTGDEPDPRRKGKPVDASDGFGWEKRSFPLRDDQLEKFLKTVAYPSGLEWPSFERINAGWPFRSLIGETWLHGSQWIDPQTGVYQLEHQGSLVRVKRLFALQFSRPYVLLPIRPIWKGFVANTLIYALILWVLAPYLHALSVKIITMCRQHFHKRGLCIKCGYDLRATEHEVCPECGCKVITAN